MADITKRLLDLHKEMQRDRHNFETLWQSVGEYVHFTKQEFNERHSPGEILTNHVMDSTANNAAKSASGALLGMLWPSTAMASVNVVPPPALEDPTQEEIDWFEKVVTPRLTRAMDDADSNLALALQEYMLDQFNFGTAGIGTFYENKKFLYVPYSVQEMFIDEGRTGEVDTVILNYEWTAHRVIEEYGEEAVHPEVIKFKDDASRKFKVMIAYGAPSRFGVVSDRPVVSFHMDIKEKHIMRSGFFNSFPIAVGRFYKALREKYGRSPAIDTLSDIAEINDLREKFINASNYLPNPALYTFSNGILGNGVIDYSPGAVTVFNSEMMRGISGDPVRPLFQVDPNGLRFLLERITQLTETISQHFMVDRLLDFNNQTQMTATEANVRLGIKNASLGTLIGRQTAELLVPLVARSFNEMLLDDRFGYVRDSEDALIAEEMREEGEPELVYIPDRIAAMLENSNESSFEIEFETPAQRLANAEELDGMLRHINLTQQLAQTNPESVLYLDLENINRNAVRLMASPPDIVRDQEEVEQAQQALAQQQQQQAVANAEQAPGV